MEKLPRKMFSGWLTIIKNTSVLGVSFVQAVQYFVFGSVEFFLVGYLTDVVRLDLFSVGIITGSEIVALVVARPLIGRISDRIGRTKPIVVGIVASCFLVAAIPFTTQFPVATLVSGCVRSFFCCSSLFNFAYGLRLSTSHFGGCLNGVPLNYNGHWTNAWTHSQRRNLCH